jgi:hypothetical protein
MLSSAGLGEEGVEGVVASPDGLVGGHLPVRLNAMLQAKNVFVLSTSNYFKKTMCIICILPVLYK